MRAGLRPADAAFKAVARSGFFAFDKPGSKCPPPSLRRTLIPCKPESSTGGTASCIEGPGRQSASWLRLPTAADGSTAYALLRANRSTCSRKQISAKAMATEQGQPVKGSCFTKTAEFGLKAGTMPRPEKRPRPAEDTLGSGSLGLIASQRVAPRYRCSQCSERNGETRESAALLPLVGQSTGRRVPDDLRIRDGDILA